MIQGIDVHEGYGQICWPLVAASGVEFAYLKCTEGNKGKDAAFERNLQQARANGIIVGAYHYAYPLGPNPAHPNRSPREQAEIAFRGCHALGADPGELSPAVDAEWPPLGEWERWGCSAKQISEWLQEYCEIARELWGRLPVIYTYPDWWRGNGKSYHGLSDADVSWAAPYPLWMATYSHPGAGAPADDERPVIPFPWKEWAIWQYSADGSDVRVPGIPAPAVDRNAIRDKAGLLRLTGRSVAEPVDDEEITPRLVDFPIVRPLVPLESPLLDEDNEPPDEVA